MIIMEKTEGGSVCEGVLEESVGKFGGVNGGVDLGGGGSYSLQGVLCGERADSKLGTGNRDRDSWRLGTQGKVRKNKCKRELCRGVVSVSMRCSCSIYLRAVSADEGRCWPVGSFACLLLMACSDVDGCSADDHERCWQYGLSCLCCLCVSGLDYVSAEFWLFCCSVSAVHFVFPVNMCAD